MAASNPAASARCTAASSARGWTCSWDAWNPKSAIACPDSARRPLTPAVGGAAGGYTGAVIAFYSRRLGCLGSVVLSILLTACLIALFLLL
jgi:hypothetical protein